MATQLVGYYRVSTTKQGRSGLGLEAQQAAVAGYAQEIGGKLVAGYTEVETGTGKAERPELDRAIAHAKFARATLVIAKMDRLTRNLGFLTRLEDSRVDFIAVDMPHANKLTVRIMVMVAEQEAEAISARTKAALQAYKARGGKLGASRPECRNLSRDAVLCGAKAAGVTHAKLADEYNTFIAPRIVELRRRGLTLRAIADELNADELRTRRGRPWSHVQVLNVLDWHARKQKAC